MARNRKPQDVLIDFDSGESIENRYADLRRIQSKLYRLDNPYVGNKRAILVDIAEALDKHNVKFKSVLDLFSGSGVVSTFFKLLDKTVISNDLLTSSYYNALVFSENSGLTLTAENMNYLCENDNPDKKSFVRDNYGSRFTPEEALFLDNYRANVETLADKIYDPQILLSETSQFGPMGGEFGIKRSKLIFRASAIVAIEHYILNHCFLGGRLNHGQVLADLEHRIEHDRNKGTEMSFNIDILPVFTPEDQAFNRAWNMDAIEAAKLARIESASGSPVEFAYIDPPYGQSQSDYATMFAFCEEYIYSKKLEELPHIQTASKKFAKKKDYKENFREVLNSLTWIPTWAVSFNASSFEDADGIVSILREFKNDVITVSIDHEYRYRKERGSAIEYLFIAR